MHRSGVFEWYISWCATDMSVKQSMSQLLTVELVKTMLILRLGSLTFSNSVIFRLLFAFPSALPSNRWKMVSRLIQQLLGLVLVPRSTRHTLANAKLILYQGRSHVTFCSEQSRWHHPHSPNVSASYPSNDDRHIQSHNTLIAKLLGTMENSICIMI
jgi:hypothetical protein